MTIFKTTTALTHYDIPANTYIIIDACESWLNGESPDRYAGWLQAFNEATGELIDYGFIHEDTMATIGFHEDDSWPVKEGYCALGCITYHGTAEEVKMSELPKALFTLYFKAELERCSLYIDRYVMSKKHFVKTSDVEAACDKQFLAQFSKLGINPKSLIAKSVKAHNDIIAKKRAAKEAKRKEQANSIGNMFPGLAALAS